MNRWRRFVKTKTCWFLAALVLFIYGNNSSLLTRGSDGKPLLLAHRGVAQTFAMEGIGNDTCTARRINAPTHPYLENTLASMEAAFQAGADVVELDVHITKDNQFAVFHDWTFGCRTNREGVTRDYTMAELKTFDIGYGYTADGGKTYPFRGKGVGLMPSLTEVLERFPDKQLLIDIKSNDPQEGRLLADYVSPLPKTQQRLLAAYGGDEPIAALKERLPELRVMSKATMKSCLLPYIAVGWSGYVPAACEGTQLHIPDQIAPWLWGWPNRLLSRMEQADTRVVVVRGNGSEFSRGFDTPEDIRELPPGFSGVLWTNRIEQIAPLYR